MATNKTRRLNARAWLAPLLAWAILLGVGLPANGQTTPPGPPIQIQDNDMTRGELANMDRFLDSHPEIAEQLRKDPSLINNATWVNNHPALEEFLETHPEVREEFRENPAAFMQAEARFDQREGDRDDWSRRRDRDDHGELTSFGKFLGSNSTIAAELAKNPSLANNKEYLANHPELGEYLKAHPAMTQQLAANPQAVMSSNFVMQASGMTVKTSTPKSKISPNP